MTFHSTARVIPAAFPLHPAIQPQRTVSRGLRTGSPKTAWPEIPCWYAQALKLWLMLRLGDGWMGLQSLVLLPAAREECR